ncbi:hypothetical protein [Microbulbifer agarilyticus]|uniref:hypothetical protein n=1 Tax=Microbulbifer agarilyticus TaxID=260552 RepID=UPI001CD50EB6|nr:hypothetical protein [Microbulbifer agarilyticus]MCA0902210.1 hypothetical protein [Microbulbifer agarilyticus]
MRLFLSLLLFFTSYVGAQEDSVHESVQKSIGKILLYQDINTRYLVGNPGNGHYYLPYIIQEEYETSISSLSVEDRVRFIWGVISFAKFGSHGTAEFAGLIKKCCASEFRDSAESYLKKAEENGNKSPAYIDESMVFKAKFFLRSI